MNLRTTIDIDLKGFFQWWGKELTFLVPKKIRELLSDRSGNLIFSVENDGFCVSFIKEGFNNGPVFTQHLESSDIESYQNIRQRFPDIANAEIILGLSENQALSKILYLPEAALENLQQVIGFELDRFTPFKADQVFFTAVPLGKTGHGQIKVLLVLTPQDFLNDQLAILNAWGVKPNRVESRQLNAGSPELQGQYNLLPEHYKPAASNFAKIVQWLLSFGLLIMLSAVLVYPVWHEKQEVDMLKGQLKALEKQTRIVDDEQFEIESMKEETGRLLNLKEQTPDLLIILNELTHLLKDNTWLTSLQYSEKHMQIQGQSPSASELIGLLEGAPYFSKVSFVSPLTQDKTTGMERFQITMDVGAKPELEPQPQQNQSESSPAKQPEPAGKKP